MARCLHCGFDNASPAAYCGGCGVALQIPSAPPPPPSRSRYGSSPGGAPHGSRSLQWESVSSLASDRFMLYETGKLLFWTALLMVTGGSVIALFQGAAEEPLDQWLFALGIFAAILAGFALSLLVIMLVFFGNRYRARVTIDPQGISWEGLSQRGKWANRTAVVAGALAANPAVAGAGLLAEAGREAAIEWAEVKRVRCHPRHCVISVMNGWRVVLRLHCYPTNYEQAARLIRAYAPHATMEGEIA